MNNVLKREGWKKTIAVCLAAVMSSSMPMMSIGATENYEQVITKNTATSSDAVFDDGTPSDAIQPLLVEYEEVVLDGREFSLVASVGEAPYYQVFKFHTPVGGGGYYTFYTEYIDDIVIDSYGYLCNENQYEALCDRIEAQTYRVSVITGESGDCLAYNDDGGNELNFYINYNLEEDTDYYFVGTRWSASYVGDYKLIFMRDINITLDSQLADTNGTDMLYSKGNLWYLDSGRTQIVSSIVQPTKAGYAFAGYYTEENGTGTQVIDHNGIPLEAMAELSLNTTVYAAWESLPEIATETLPNGNVRGVYNQTLELVEDKSVTWSIEAGGLPAGLELDAESGVISGVPTTAGLFTFKVKAMNLAGSDTKEYSILIEDRYTIKVETDGNGTAIANVNEAVAGTSVILTPSPAAGYGLIGWEIVQGNITISDNRFVMPAEDVIVKAVFGLLPEIATEQLQFGIVGTAYSQTLELTEDMPVKWSIEAGELPAGLELDAESGVISGVPTVAGTTTVTVKATNKAGSSVKELSIMVKVKSKGKGTGSGGTGSSGSTTINDGEVPLGNGGGSGSLVWNFNSNDGTWTCQKSNGVNARDEWLQATYNGITSWYHFGTDTKMDIGWFKDTDGSWYYLNPKADGQQGAMQTGWLTDPMDGYRYYLDLTTGRMATGWKQLAGEWYYFNETVPGESGWYYSEGANRWLYDPKAVMPLGALVEGKER